MSKWILKGHPRGWWGRNFRQRSEGQIRHWKACRGNIHGDSAPQGDEVCGGTVAGSVCPENKSTQACRGQGCLSRGISQAPWSSTGKSSQCQSPGLCASAAPQATLELSAVRGNVSCWAQEVCKCDVSCAVRRTTYAAYGSLSSEVSAHAGWREWWRDARMQTETKGKRG